MSEKDLWKEAAKTIKKYRRAIHKILGILQQAGLVTIEDFWKEIEEG